MSIDELTAAEYLRIVGTNEPKPLVPASKYKAQPTEVDGIRFASKAEARRYKELKHLRDGGEIDGLKLQPRMPIEVNGMKICTYVADFSYYDVAAKQTVVEDVKGVSTPVYRIKKKLVKAIYGIDIKEVK